MGIAELSPSLDNNQNDSSDWFCFPLQMLYGHKNDSHKHARNNISTDSQNHQRF